MPRLTKEDLEALKSKLNNTDVNQAAKDVAASNDAGALDSAEAGVKIQKPTYEKKLAQMKSEFANPNEPKQDLGNTLLPPETYNRGMFEPAIEAQTDRTRGLAGQVNVDPQSRYVPNTFSDKARPAEQIDLANLDESNVMQIPFLETKDFDLPKIMDVHPKDKSLRFRWANFKNMEGAQYATLCAMGFTNCVPQDCVEEDLMKSLVKEDGAIKYFDVVLVKINVLLLMARYKRNIMKAMNQVARWDQAAMREAENTFRNSVSQDLLAAMKRQGIQVDFYSPTMGEIRDQNKSFGGFSKQ